MMRNHILLVAVVALVAPLAAPVGGAHGEPVPASVLGYPCGPDPTHHYTGGLSLDVKAQSAPGVYWRTTVVLLDSCVNVDGEGDFGVGGGFLPVDHHGFYDPGTNTWNADVCVDDDVFGLDVDFVVGVSPGGGVINEVASGRGCVFVSLPTPYFTGSGPSPGADGGVWVFLFDDAEARANVAVNVSGGNVDTNTATTSHTVAPTTGHIYTVP